MDLIATAFLTGLLATRINSFVITLDIQKGKVPLATVDELGSARCASPPPPPPPLPPPPPPPRPPTPPLQSGLLGRAAVLSRRCAESVAALAVLCPLVHGRGRRPVSAWTEGAFSCARAQRHDRLQAACGGTDRCEMSVHAYKLIKPGVAAALSAIIYPATLLGAANEWVHNKRHI